MRGREEPLVLEEAGAGRYWALEPEGAPPVVGPAHPIPCPTPPDRNDRTRVAPKPLSLEQLPPRPVIRARLDATMAPTFSQWIDEGISEEEQAKRVEGLRYRIRKVVLPHADLGLANRLVADRVEDYLVLHADIARRRLQNWKPRERKAAENRWMLKRQLAEWSKHRDPKAGCVWPWLHCYVYIEPPAEQLEPFLDPTDAAHRRGAVQWFRNFPHQTAGQTLIAALTGEPVENATDAVRALIASDYGKLRRVGFELAGKLEVPA